MVIDKKKISKEMEDYFVERNNSHIDFVRKYCKKINEYDNKRFKGIIERGDNHDKTKYAEPERTPYIYICWQYKCSTDNSKFDISQEERDDLIKASEYHVTNSRHHPEYHSLIKDNKVGYVIDAENMPDLDIAEMVADWCAMSEERHNNPKEWANTKFNVKWAFTDNQKELIYELIDAVWEDSKNGGKMQLTEQDKQELLSQGFLSVTPERSMRLVASLKERGIKVKSLDYGKTEFRPDLGMEATAFETEEDAIAFKNRMPKMHIFWVSDTQWIAVTELGANVLRKKFPDMKEIGNISESSKPNLKVKESEGLSSIDSLIEEGKKAIDNGEEVEKVIEKFLANNKLQLKRYEWLQLKVALREYAGTEKGLVEDKKPFWGGTTGSKDLLRRFFGQLTKKSSMQDNEGETEIPTRIYQTPTDRNHPTTHSDGEKVPSKGGVESINGQELYNSIKHGDKVTIRKGDQEVTGKAQLMGPAGWVLMKGDRFGNPLGIASPDNIVRVQKRAKKEAYMFVDTETGEELGNLTWEMDEQIRAELENDPILKEIKEKITEYQKEHPGVLGGTPDNLVETMSKRFTELYDQKAKEYLKNKKASFQLKITGGDFSKIKEVADLLGVPVPANDAGGIITVETIEDYNELTNALDMHRIKWEPLETKKDSGLGKNQEILKEYDILVEQVGDSEASKQIMKKYNIDLPELMDILKKTPEYKKESLDKKSIKIISPGMGTSYEYECYLVDDGTLDTVISVKREGYDVQEFRYSTEYAEEFRDEKTGELTEKGFKELCDQSIDSYETGIQGEILEKSKKEEPMKTKLEALKERRLKKRSLDYPKLLTTLGVGQKVRIWDSKMDELFGKEKVKKGSSVKYGDSKFKVADIIEYATTGERIDKEYELEKVAFLSKAADQGDMDKLTDELASIAVEKVISKTKSQGDSELLKQDRLDDLGIYVDEVMRGLTEEDKVTIEAYKSTGWTEDEIKGEVQAKAEKILSESKLKTKAECESMESIAEAVEHGETMGKWWSITFDKPMNVIETSEIAAEISKGKTKGKGWLLTVDKEGHLKIKSDSWLNLLFAPLAEYSAEKFGLILDTGMARKIEKSIEQQLGMNVVEFEEIPQDKLDIILENMKNIQVAPASLKLEEVLEGQKVDVKGMGSGVITNVSKNSDSQIDFITVGLDSGKFILLVKDEKDKFVMIEQEEVEEKPGDKSKPLSGDVKYTKVEFDILKEKSK